MTEVEIRNAAIEVETLQQSLQEYWPIRAAVVYNAGQSPLSITPLLFASGFGVKWSTALLKVSLVSKLVFDSMQHLLHSQSEDRYVSVPAALAEAMSVAGTLSRSKMAMQLIRESASACFWSFDCRLGNRGLRNIASIQDVDWIARYRAGAAAARFGVKLVALELASSPNLAVFVDAVDDYVIAATLVAAVRSWREDLLRGCPSIVMSALSRQAPTSVAECVAQNDASIATTAVRPIANKYTALAVNLYRSASQGRLLPRPWGAMASSTLSSLERALIVQNSPDPQPDS